MEIYRAIQNGCIDEAQRVEPRARRFWQIHLSSAIILMFAAGAFIWLNVIPREGSETTEVFKYTPVIRYGFPATIYFYATEYRDYFEISVIGAIVNVVTLLVGLGALVLLCEEVIHEQATPRLPGAIDPQ